MSGQLARRGSRPASWGRVAGGELGLAGEGGGGGQLSAGTSCQLAARPIPAGGRNSSTRGCLQCIETYIRATFPYKFPFSAVFVWTGWGRGCDKEDGLFMNDDSFSSVTMSQCGHCSVL